MFSLMHTDQSNLRQWQQHLANDIAQHYRGAGKFAYHFAKNKVRFDPLFLDVFRAGLNIDGNEADVDLLDLGCGQGLLGMALVVQQMHESPRIGSYLGIEYSAANVARAQSAFASMASLTSFDSRCHQMKCVQGNIIDVPYPSAKIIALIDVLHYLNYEQQEQVLMRARSALAGQGKLLLRIGDAEMRQSNRISRMIDLVVSRWRGVDSGRIYCRGLQQWMQLLESLGFVSRVISSASSMFYSNVMIVAEPS
jgi:SAM-dependent methyltransferase